MSKIAHYVILACPHCGKRHVRAEFASVSAPAFVHALDPPHIHRVCRGCGVSVKLGDFHRVEKVSVKERFERYPPSAQDLPSFLRSEVFIYDDESSLPELF
jgi:hypothetical protein